MQRSNGCEMFVNDEKVLHSVACKIFVIVKVVSVALRLCLLICSSTISVIVVFCWKIKCIECTVTAAVKRQRFARRNQIDWEESPEQNGITAKGRRLCD